MCHKSKARAWPACKMKNYTVYALSCVGVAGRGMQAAESGLKRNIRQLRLENYLVNDNAPSKT